MQETAFERASSGQFTLPGPNGRILQLHREGVDNLDPRELIPWPAILRLDVYQTHVVWVLKKVCACGASWTTYYNPACTVCDGLGNAPGVMITVPHDSADEQSVNAYINCEGYTMFWARQSGKKTILRDKTPVWNLDIPRINFHCMSMKNKSNLDNLASLPPEYSGQGVVTRKRSHAYHDELYKEIIAIQMEKLNTAAV